MARDKLGVSCELIDLRTITPWDEKTVIEVREPDYLLRYRNSFFFNFYKYFWTELAGRNVFARINIFHTDIKSINFIQFRARLKHVSLRLIPLQTPSPTIVRFFLQVQLFVSSTVASSNLHCHLDPLINARRESRITLKKLRQIFSDSFSRLKLSQHKIFSNENLGN